MKRNVIAIMPVFLIIYLLNGCANKSKQEIVGEVGAVTGGVLGGAVAVVTGEDDYIVLGAGIGAAAGAIIGSFLGEKLDELDAIKAEMATMTALTSEDLSPVKWKSDENQGVSGKVAVIEEQKINMSNCKTVKHIININGEEIEEEETYCLDSEGSWSAS